MRARNVRLFASHSNLNTIPKPTPSIFNVFDRETKIWQKDVAASNVSQSRVVDYIKNEIGESFRDRLLDIKRRYNKAICIGSGSNQVARVLDEEELADDIHIADSSVKSVLRDKEFDNDFANIPTRHQIDEEHPSMNSLFKTNSTDIIISSLGLHWVNDLPGALIQFNHALKPDSPFLGCLYGGDSLFELRTSLQLAEQERWGGFGPHVSPMTDTTDVGNLMNRAGFTLLTIDIDDLVINYPSMFELIEDLKFMGESNSINGRRAHISRDTLIAASEIYKSLHGNEDGTIPATFQIINVIGWKRSDDQLKPLKRGSATRSMKELED
ncbi:hypothetical protein E3Q11_03652 [Wallemia mellicola]|nr:hypothetical protein E3Q11_03652 [Wallemia mellicola]TIC51789.1 hypothetical protein E3Q04_03732 [Wallemia mellicola]